MSLLVTAVAVAGGLVVGRYLARALLRRDPDTKGAAGKGADASTKAEAPVPAADPLGDFPCHLGDVVIARAGEEAWLAGALVLSERTPVAALFFAPDAGGDRALFVRPKPSPSLVWLMPLAQAELAIGSDPPSSLEHKRTRFERLRRVPFRVDRLGTGAPDLGGQVVVGEYAAGAERLLVLVGAGPARVFRGEALEEGTYDVLPGGKGTLDG